jgi:hypothetical protein
LQFVWTPTWCKPHAQIFWASENTAHIRFSGMEERFKTTFDKYHQNFRLSKEKRTINFATTARQS